jgi:twitching motility protein PilT
MEMNDLLEILMKKGGSDLHILAGLAPAIRLHGELVPLEGHDRMSPEVVEGLVYSMLDGDQKQRFEHDPEWRYELDFAHGVPGVGRFRFNVHRQRGSIGVVARALASEIPDLDSLGLPSSVARLHRARKGLSLVTGPTGSGKSTTLAAIIDCINRSRADHIITIEDPVEYLHNSKKSYVMQREVGNGADTLSFKNALKYALRQDPDVILIGEMRDHETIGIAITSAETGHLVFGTLHTASAAQTVGRIIDVFPADQVEQVKVQLAGNLVGVLAQILLPKKDGSGRAVACEIMFSNAAIMNNIRMNNVGAIYQSIQTGANDGMQTMDASVAKLVQDGIVKYSAAVPYIRDESTLRMLAPFAGESPAAAAPAAPPAQPAADPSAAGPDTPRKDTQTLGKMVIPPWEQQTQHLGSKKA